MNESDRREMLDNEKYYREKYGLQLLTERSYKRFKEAKTTQEGNKIIQDEPTYRIVEQNDYKIHF